MLEVEVVRSQFPALSRTWEDTPLAYFDGPGGTQVPQPCIDAMVAYLSRCNANHGGAFSTGVESDAIVAEAHEAMADFLNARRAEEIVFGQNMTSLTFALSRSIAAALSPGDEVVLTRLDHDANFTPWVLAAADRGLVVRVVDIDPDDCTLRLDELERFLGPRTRLVAFAYASNAVGTINPVARIVEMAHSVGAWAFVDAVHWAPHGVIDVQQLGCDFLACSPYKFFGPHLGALYGRHEVLEPLPAYKVRPGDNHLPGRLETGTQSHEALAGLIGTMEYLARLGERWGDPAATPARSERAGRLRAAMAAIGQYEGSLKRHLLDGLRALAGVRVYGITDHARMAERVPTFAITVAGWRPRDVADLLGRHGICVWDGNYYAINLTERLGVEAGGGMVRIGLAHYNTREEIDRLLAVLATIAG